MCVSEKSPLCCPGGWKLVLCGSRHLTAAERNYSTLEGEALAIAWCLKKACLFLLGCKNLTLVTDHKALTRIFGDKELKDIVNPRLLNLKEKTLMFTFCIKYLKGDTYCVADALSRYPILSGGPEGLDEDDEELVCAAMIAATVTAAEDKVGHVVDLRQVEEEAEQDEEYRLLRECVANDSWAQHKDWEPLALQDASARGASSCTPVTRNTCSWSYLRPLGVQSSRTFMWGTRAGTQCYAGRGNQSTGQGLMRRWSRRGVNVQYAIRTPPPASQRPSCPPYSRSTHSSRWWPTYFNWAATPILPSLTGSRDGSKWSTCQAMPPAHA